MSCAVCRLAKQMFYFLGGSRVKHGAANTSGRGCLSKIAVACASCDALRSCAVSLAPRARLHACIAHARMCSLLDRNASVLVQADRQAGQRGFRLPENRSESTNATRCSPLTCCQRSGKKVQVSAPRSSTCASCGRRSQGCIKARLASQRVPARYRVTREHWYLAARRPPLESRRVRCPASFSARALVFAFRVETCVPMRGLCAQNDIRDALSTIKSDIAERPPETLRIAKRKWLGNPKLFVQNSHSVHLILAIRQRVA